MLDVFTASFGLSCRLDLFLWRSENIGFALEFRVKIFISTLRSGTFAPQAHRKVSWIRAALLIFCFRFFFLEFHSEKFRKCPFDAIIGYAFDASQFFGRRTKCYAGWCALIVIHERNAHILRSVTCFNLPSFLFFLFQRFSPWRLDAMQHLRHDPAIARSIS